jgi:hypothetical protein
MGESQNTFGWTGWMTGRMDGKSFTTTTSFTVCNVLRKEMRIGTQRRRTQKETLSLSLSLSRSLLETWFQEPDDRNNKILSVPSIFFGKCCCDVVVVVFFRSKLLIVIRM